MLLGIELEDAATNEAAMNKTKSLLSEPLGLIQCGEILAEIHAWAHLPARGLGKAFQRK